MTQNRSVRHNEASVSMNDLASIRQSIQSTKNTGKMTSTDLILEINRIPKSHLSSDIVHNRISEYFVNNG